MYSMFSMVGDVILTAYRGLDRVTYAISLDYVFVSMLGWFGKSVLMREMRNGNVVCSWVYDGLLRDDDCQPFECRIWYTMAIKG